MKACIALWKSARPKNKIAAAIVGLVVLTHSSHASSDTLLDTIQGDTYQGGVGWALENVVDLQAYQGLGYVEQEEIALQFFIRYCNGGRGRLRELHPSLIRTKCLASSAVGVLLFSIILRRQLLPAAIV